MKGLIPLLVIVLLLTGCPSRVPTTKPVAPPQVVVAPPEPSVLVSGLGQTSVTRVFNGKYLVQNDVFGSSEPFSLRIYPNTGAWEIADSARLRTNGVGAFPSSVFGCIGNGCSDSGLPAKLSSFNSFQADVSFTRSDDDGAPWDWAFDIWTNPTATPPGLAQPGGVELMIILAHGPYGISPAIPSRSSWEARR